MTAPTPPVRGILETALYVDDLSRAVGFYRRVFSFPVLWSDDRGTALDVGGAQVLLLFRRGASTRPVETAGGVIPPHDGDGPAHLAFAIDPGDVSRWRERLDAEGVEIESEVAWNRGGTSLYCRDPDGHAVELVTPGCWPIY